MMPSSSDTTEAMPAAAGPREASTSATPVLDLVLKTLEDAKAEETVSIDITGKSPLTDHMVITSGRSHRHVGAVADQLERALREAGYGKPRVEGLPHCDWVLVDADDVIVHIFRPEVRDFYNIEKLWSAEFTD
ncbi:ribosome-associated protein [Devosia enhydra]|uniref:Ribosomal silencing factor RsfS n=2 Tax=Devosia enhydra TaxID=665118 RepID=A0A1K2I2Z1_9HYPH|nr:ribosome-associated protein [Devosia enhydra]